MTNCKNIERQCSLCKRNLWNMLNCNSTGYVPASCPYRYKDREWVWSFDLTGISYVQLSRVIETGSNYHILLPSGVRRPFQHQTLLWSSIVSTPAAISCEIQDISIVLSSTRFYCRNKTLLFQVSTVDLTCVICGTNILCQCVPDKEEGRTPLSRHVTIIRI